MDPAQRDAIEAALNQPILRVERRSGGDHAEAFQLHTSEGTCFLKIGGGAIEAEIAGLNALRRCKALVIPEVLASGALPRPWLVLESLEPGPRVRGALGHALATLHAEQRDTHGFPCTTFCGPTPQDNRPNDHWPTFYVEQHLRPVLDATARRRGWSSRDRNTVEAFIERWAPRLPAGPASLLHGDLWSGNHLSTPQGPALIDPAAYWGHHEAELGMIALFGDFDAADLDAYSNMLPLEPGWRERLGIYVLFHVLNHDLIFGGGYRSQAVRLCEADGYRWR